MRSVATTFELRGAKTLLRLFDKTDVSEAYIGWLNDPEVVRFSNQRFVRHDVNTSLQYLATFTGTANLFLAIRRLDAEPLIGTMTVYRAPAHGTADVGIMIGERSAWGKGYGQDAWSTLVNWLFGEGGARKVTAGTLARNVGMVRIMERSGMHCEGVRRAQEIVDGRPEDILYFARFRDA